MTSVLPRLRNANAEEDRLPPDLRFTSLPPDRKVGTPRDVAPFGHLCYKLAAGSARAADEP